MKQEEELGIELEWAKHFMYYITRQQLSPICKPDAEDRNRRRPDYIFEDARGKKYILEVTRWLTPKLRRLEDVALRSIAAPLKGELQGTFTLEVPLDSFRGGKIPKETAEVLVSEIQAIAIARPMTHRYPLSYGFILCKVRDDGSRLVPWITQEELPYDLDVNSEVAKILQGELESILHKKDGKFKGYSGNRVLLINISQCGLDIYYHASASKDGQGIVLRWLAALLKQPSNIDYIYLEPGVGVWQVANGKRVLTGHRHVNAHRGYYVEVWRRPGLPTLLT